MGRFMNRPYGGKKEHDINVDTGSLGEIVRAYNAAVTYVIHHLGQTLFGSGNM